MEKHNIQIRGAPGSDQKKVRYHFRRLIFFITFSPIISCCTKNSFFGSGFTETAPDPDLSLPTPDPDLGWFLFVSGYNQDPDLPEGFMRKKTLLIKKIVIYRMSS
jgi:hypothetical protein